MFSQKKKNAVSICLDGWPFTCCQPCSCCDKIEVFDWKGVIKHYLFNIFDNHTIYLIIISKFMNLNRTYLLSKGGHKDNQVQFV